MRGLWGNSIAFLWASNFFTGLGPGKHIYIYIYINLLIIYLFQWYLCFLQISTVLCRWGEDSGFSLLLTPGCPLATTGFKTKAQDFLKAQENAMSFWWTKHAVLSKIYLLTPILSVLYPAIPYQGDSRSFVGEANYSFMLKPKVQQKRKHWRPFPRL